MLAMYLPLLQDARLHQVVDGAVASAWRCTLMSAKRTLLRARPYPDG
jgi:hypothetical protein